MRFGDLSKLGEDITEELEYIPGRFVVNKITRPRMACRRCEAISQAPMPSRPIERGRPGPGLLAHVLVSKFADHLPLYRQSQIYAREGVDLDRSTMADWVGKSTGLLEPLAEAIAKRAKGGSLFADDTPLKMLAPGNKKTRTARIWAYVRDERPWSGPCATGDKQTICPAVLDGHRPAFGISSQWIERVSTRSSTCLVIKAGCMRWLAGFNGVFGEGKATEVACMAHIRRKFVDVFAAQGSAIAEEAIKRIAQLYGVEKQARGQSPEARAALRQENAKPIFDDHGCVNA